MPMEMRENSLCFPILIPSSFLPVTLSPLKRAFLLQEACPDYPSSRCLLLPHLMASSNSLLFVTEEPGSILGACLNRTSLTCPHA